jgi:hypothetical protein
MNILIAAAAKKSLPAGKKYSLIAIVAKTPAEAAV